MIQVTNELGYSLKKQQKNGYKYHYFQRICRRPPCRSGVLIGLNREDCQLPCAQYQHNHVEEEEKGSDYIYNRFPPEGKAVVNDVHSYVSVVQKSIRPSQHTYCTPQVHTRLITPNERVIEYIPGNNLTEHYQS